MATKKEILRTNYWVEFWSPGIIVGESWAKAYTHKPDPKKVVWPKEAYAFRVYKRVDLEREGKVYKGETEQIGKLYYHPASKVETLAQVKKNRGNESILVSNMECNHWKKIIWTRWNNWPQPYEPKKMCILPRKR